MNASLPDESRAPDRMYDGCWGWGSGPGWLWPLIPLTIFGSILVVALSAWALGWAPSWSGAYPPFWPLFPLGFLAVVLLVFVLARWARGGRGWAGYRYYPEAPEEVVRRRYARGEISAEQMREMNRKLRGEE